MSDSLEDIALPKIGKNYWTNRLSDGFATGVYQMFRTDRPVVMIPVNPTTIGTYYISAGSEPAGDANAISIPNGNPCTLDGVGIWYLKQSSGSSQKFLMIDAGGAGNAQAMLSALGIISSVVNVAQIGGVAQTGVDIAATYAARTPVTPGAPFAVTSASQLAIASRAGRKFLYMYATNFASGCTQVTVSFATPVVSKRGIVFVAGNASDFKSFDALGGVFTGAVYAITDAGTADLYFVEAT